MYPAPLFFVFGSLALVFAAFDVRMIVRRGVVHRLARHLWRISFSLLLTLGSFFPGQARLFPASLRHTSWPYVMHVLVFGSMLFWLARVKSRRRVQRAKIATPSHGNAMAGEAARA